MSNHTEHAAEAAQNTGLAMRLLLVASPVFALAACNVQTGPDPDSFYDEQRMVYTMDNGAQVFAEWL